ncbi:DUF488 domain-containing protein [Georgenia sp. TF02-10]|uniref:DUF488 domain-containing protein n=1 Tax=Georgenia sp. TF02-10 TaxID=2917725 RepID=UPI001FA7811E|nr:DUF488 domain-containing protein [Georgenia sp. TF02-10]UNX55166.1 DUF488 domain-containing protein [Georgenia sp. TF02-10]
MGVRLARVYDPAPDDGGYRVLVDRVWPRGVRKADARIDRWLKEVGPSTELRRWFGHDPARFAEFAERYRAELAGNPAWDELEQLAREHPDLTLVYGAKDAEHNQAVVLAGMLKG